MAEQLREAGLGSVSSGPHDCYILESAPTGVSVSILS